MSKHKKIESSLQHKPSRSRDIPSYDRPGPTREPNKRILIVCEGAKTEPNYFEELRRYLKLNLIHVKIANRGGAPASVVGKAFQLVHDQKQAKTDDKKVAEPGFDAVWCVFDVECPHLNPTFNQAVQTADQHNFLLAISNPAFEFWYILHYEYTTRAYANGGEVKDHIRRYIPGYTESMPVFNRLIESTDIAYQRAKKLAGNHPQVGIRFPNPSTSVFLLVKELVDMSSGGREHFHLA